MTISTDPYLNLLVHSGESGESRLSLRNRGAEAVRITVEVMDYSQTEEGLPVFLPAGSSQWGAGGWLDVQPSSFILDKGEEQTATVRFNAPAWAKTHTYSAAILFRAEAATPTSESVGAAARIIGKVGSIVFLRVKGKEDIRASGEIVSSRIPRLILSSPARFIIQYRNTGNIHTQVKGGIALQPFFSLSGSLYVPLMPRWVIPGTTLDLEGQLVDAPLAGIYRAKTQLVDQDGHLLAATAFEDSIIIISWQFLTGLLLVAAGLLGIKQLHRSRRCLPSEA